MKYLLTIILATLGGFFARWYMLRSDYRQYPSYPQGWAIHLFLGFIGGLIGAIIVPAFLEKEFSAVSFLLLSATQFREVRNMERNTLTAMEQSEMVKRGSAYIEGIARVFEARNYLAIWVSLAIGITLEALAFLGLWKILFGILVGILLALLLNQLMKGQKIGDIAQVELAPLSFDGAILKVGDYAMKNVGLIDAQQVFEKQGLGALIKPKGPNDKATLANLGQMQAVAYDVASMIGVYMDVDEQEFLPMIRREPATGTLHFAFMPSEPDSEAFLAAIKRVPVLEGSIRRPLTSHAGKMLD